MRPILMTAIASLAGFLPLVVATTAGANSQQSLGTVIFRRPAGGHGPVPGGGAALLCGDQAPRGPLRQACHRGLSGRYAQLLEPVQRPAQQLAEQAFFNGTWLSAAPIR